MTSKQVKLILVLMFLTGCVAGGAPKRPDPLPSPHDGRQVWAVAPLRNESGSGFADGDMLADQIARQLEGVEGIDVLPVNRVITAMDVLRMPEVASVDHVARLQRTLQVDAIVVGSVTAYNPYDPPKIGLRLELYSTNRATASVDPTQLRSAASSSAAALSGEPKTPDTTVSVFLDSGDPDVRHRLQSYARDRGSRTMPESAFRRATVDAGLTPMDEHAWRLYRISMDLYVEFASNEICRQLLTAQSRRNRPALNPSSP